MGKILSVLEAWSKTATTLGTWTVPGGLLEYKTDWDVDRIVAYWDGPTAPTPQLEWEDEHDGNWTNQTLRMAQVVESYLAKSEGRKPRRLNVKT